MTDKPKDQEIRGRLFVNKAAFGGEMRTESVVDDLPPLRVEIVWSNSDDYYNLTVNEDKPNG